MKLTLRPATPSDAPVLIEIYFSAFSTDAISLRCFPRNNPAVHDFWYNSILEEMNDANNHFLCVIDEDAQNPNATTPCGTPSPHIIAFAKWVSPVAPVSTDLPTWPEGADTAFADHFFGSLVRNHERVMRGRKHWYLELLGTRPEYRRRGAAGLLLRWGLERADAEMLEAYLEASPDGKPVYEHFGFREVQRLVLLQGQFVEVMMIRPVKGEMGE